MAAATDKIFRKLSLLDEERLCKQVRHYPIIYDKAHPLYKDRDAVSETWTEIANSLDFLSDGNFAQSSFENAKRRYLKRRVDYRKLLNKADTSTMTFERARKELNCYSFLFWLDEYLKNRRIKEIHESNLSSSAVDLSMHTMCEDAYSGSRDHEYSEGERSPDPKSPRIQAVFALGNGQSMYNRPLQRERVSQSEDRQPMMVQSQKESSFYNQTDSIHYEQDAEYYFAMSMAAEIRSFNERERSLIKNEINNVIFKYQMERYRNSQPSSHREENTQQTCSSKTEM